MSFRNISGLIIPIECLISFVPLLLLFGHAISCVLVSHVKVVEVLCHGSLLHNIVSSFGVDSPELVDGLRRHGSFVTVLPPVHTHDAGGGLVEHVCLVTMLVPLHALVSEVR